MAPASVLLNASRLRNVVRYARSMHVKPAYRPPATIDIKPFSIRAQALAISELCGKWPIYGDATATSAPVCSRVSSSSIAAAALHVSRRSTTIV
jgi:hypothetical protein